MLEQMTQKLKELYSDLGLPQSVLNSVAGFAVIGLPADADADVISSRASEKSVADMLKAFQSHADKVRTSSVKAKKDENKDDDGEPNDVPAYIKEILDAQKEMQQKLIDRIAVLEGASAAKDFDAMVSRIGKELHLEGPMLDLCKSGLSSDMDEKAIKDKLGAAKKVLLDNGVHFEEKVSASEESSRRQSEIEDARAWAKEHAKTSNE